MSHKKRVRASQPRTKDGLRRSDKILGLPPALRRHAIRYNINPESIPALDKRLKGIK